MTKEALEQSLPRGAAQGTWEHIQHIRQWCVLRGMPERIVRKQSTKQLLALYNRPDDTLDKRKYCWTVAERQWRFSAQTATQTEPTKETEAETMSTLENIVANIAKQAAAEQWASQVKSLEEKIATIATATSRTIRLERPELSAVTIEGAHKQLPQLLRAMHSRMANGYHPNILICGPTGSGKTHAVHAAATALGLEFFSNGALSQDFQLVGFLDAQGVYRETEFRRAFDKPAVYLFDEIDASDNSALLALAGALANASFAFPCGRVDRHKDSIIVAAANTWGNGATSEFVGRNKLDGAIRSRFPVRIAWDYDESLEAAMCGNPEWAKKIQTVRKKAKDAGLKIIIDPRMTQAGAALLAAGCTEQETAEMTFLADLSADQRRLLGY